MEGTGPRYVVEIGGPSCPRNLWHYAGTVREARKIAESYGDKADWALIKNARGIVVATHDRDPERPTGGQWISTEPLRKPDKRR